MVTRMKATEQPFSGKYARGHFKGTFVCVCCGAKLFDASNKFESGTGWPSFWRPVSEKALDTAMDYSEPAEARVEVACHRCGAHLGHVFQDGPPPTGLRYCMNSVALSLESEQGVPTPSRKSSRTPASKSTRKGKPSNGDIATKKPGKQAEATEPKF
jgi:peptide-methionine (R)-S-oxide reductase